MTKDCVDTPVTPSVRHNHFLDDIAAWGIRIADPKDAHAVLAAYDEAMRMQWEWENAPFFDDMRAEYLTDRHLAGLDEPDDGEDDLDPEYYSQ